MKRKWHLPKHDDRLIHKLCEQLHCHPATAAVLINRNIISFEEANLFINAPVNQIHSPFTIKDMDVAVQRIVSAINQNEKILIFGDYDVDGMTATSVLFEFLHYTGANVSYYIPHRLKEGYSLKVDHISRLMIPRMINLVITVDCGSDSKDAIESAKKAGVDVIITDHHEISRKLSAAVAVINPKRNDCRAGFEHLAGVGVAFCLVICLRKALRDAGFWKTKTEPNLKNFCDLVALGTIADMVPLEKENRIFSKIGLRLMSSGNRPGIHELLKISGINHSFISSEDISFRLAPRLNAAGRMGYAKAAVDLLMTTNHKTAGYLVQSINEMNLQRRDIETKTLEQIEKHLDKNPKVLEKSSLILGQKGWHEGILGIVASRLAKKYYKPVVLVSIKGERGKGSARSIPEVDLYKGLTRCKDHLIAFGGHSMAAGLELKIDKLDLFRERFEKVVHKMTLAKKLIDTINIDYELKLDRISEALIDELELLEPFGNKNPEPLFLTRDIRIIKSKPFGKNHLKMVIKQNSSKSSDTYDAVQFNINSNEISNKHLDYILFKLRWNRWTGQKIPQLILQNI